MKVWRTRYHDQSGKRVEGAAVDETERAEAVRSTTATTMTTTRMQDDQIPLPPITHDAAIPSAQNHPRPCPQRRPSPSATAPSAAILTTETTAPPSSRTSSPASSPPPSPNHTAHQVLG